MGLHLRVLHLQALDFWLARASVALVAALQLLMINDLTIGPRWLAPTIELTLLVPLSIATAWTQSNARNASTDLHWQKVARDHHRIRVVALALTALITLINFGALTELVDHLLRGTASKQGQTLLLDALNIWGTNVIIFGLWYWSTDRGGPPSRGLTSSEKCDFLFPQITMDGTTRPPDWSPGFIDYLYLSFTNATAFSPTDTLPLSPRAKLLMMFESIISLLTIALVAARAVNILS